MTIIGTPIVVGTLLTTADAIAAIQAYTWLSVQSSTEAATTPATNIYANLLYSSASRNQGNFSVFYAMAVAQLTLDCSRMGITLTTTYTSMAVAYLVQFYFERKFKDWNAKQVQSGDDSITRDGSGAWAAYQDVLNMFKTLDTTIVQHIDYTGYPAGWKQTQLIPEPITLVTP